MEFFAVNGKRPVRLSEATRKFAYESLGHKYGLLTKETPSVLLDGYEGFADLTPLQKYDIAIRKIAEESPIRICEGEKISGAATLGNAIYHIIPASFQDKAVCGSVSHLTIDFETVLQMIQEGREIDFSLYKKEYFLYVDWTKSSPVPSVDGSYTRAYSIIEMTSNEEVFSGPIEDLLDFRFQGVASLRDQFSDFKFQCIF